MVIILVWWARRDYGLGTTGSGAGIYGRNVPLVNEDLGIDTVRIHIHYLVYGAAGLKVSYP